MNSLSSCGFVTVSFGGWDHHNSLEAGLAKLAPQVDRAVSAFIEDTCARGLDQDILLIITGDFGRTPKLNGNGSGLGGRNHWPELSTLALAGGGLRMGQVVGESSARVEFPKIRPISPQDLMATVFHVLGIPLDLHFQDATGRPVPMIENGKPIAELV